MKKTNYISSLALMFTMAISIVSVAQATNLSVMPVSTNAGVNLGIHQGDNSNDRKVGTEFKTDTEGKFQVRTFDQSKTRATTEIDQRVNSLNKLSARIDAMVRVGDTNKATLKSTIQTQISNLTNLKAKITSDTDLATLKADIASVTRDFRIYMLVSPQLNIMATSDRIMTTSDMMTTFGAKLQARITDANNAGKDVTAMNTSYVDFTAKVADAKIHAQTAMNLTASLAPDNGNQTVADANKLALSNAHAEIKIAREDLKTARKDAGDIVKVLKSFNLSASLKSDTKTEVKQ